MLLVDNYTGRVYCICTLHMALERGSFTCGLKKERKQNPGNPK